MNTPVLRYSFDPTAADADNLVVGELQTMPARKIRAVAPEYGPFYTQSLIITDMATNKALTSDQFYCAELETVVSVDTGFEAMRIIMITDQTVSPNISLQYQVVGGEFSASASAIISQIYNLNLDDRPASWPAIIGKPDAFPPSAHLHDAGDLYGFEYVTAALDRIRAAILLGDEASHDAIYKYIDLGTTDLQSQITALQTQLNNHMADTTNPHKTTAAQVGAYSYAQSDANLTAAKNALQASINATEAELQAHEANTNNPHQVTAAQVGAYTKAQSDANLAATQTTLQGNINAVQTNLNTHIADQTNPHKTSAAQVGAYTTAQTDAAIAAAVNAAKLTFTPVQQGGGANQGTNKLYFGWDGSMPRLQVDSTDIGQMATVNWSNSQIANLQNQINTKAAASLPFLYQYNGQDATLGNVTTNGDLHTNGTIYCNNDIWAFWSDERLKEEIVPIKHALAKLRTLSGVTYKHNALAGIVNPGADLKRRYMGLLAGQVNKVAPEVTALAGFDRNLDGTSKSGENYLTLQYERLMGLVVEAIKAVDDKVDTLVSYARRGGLITRDEHREIVDVEWSERPDLIPA